MHCPRAMLRFFYRNLLSFLVFASVVQLKPAIPFVMSRIVSDAPVATAKMEEIFLGRCWEYFNVNNLHLSPKKNCSNLWTLFSTAFTGFKECEISPERYDPFVDEAFMDIPPDRSVFWEGVVNFISDFSIRGRRYTAISHTLAGYILDNLRWCNGKPANEVKRGEECTFKWAPNCSEHSFWVSASRKFAKASTGRVSLYLNGSLPEVYSNGTIFGTIELPELTWPKNFHLDVILVASLGSPPTERCETGSLLQLRNTLEKKGLTMTCFNYPVAVSHYYCMDNPDVDECRLYYDPACLEDIGADGQKTVCAYRSGNAASITHRMRSHHWWIAFFAMVTQNLVSRYC